MSMPADELREIWTAEPGQERTDMNELLDQLKQRTHDFDRMIARCNLLMYPISGFLALVNLWIGLRAEDPLARAPRFWLAAFFIWTIVFLWRYARASKKPAPEETLSAYRQALAEKYDRQIRLLRALKYWYILPLWLGMMLVSAAYLRHMGKVTGLLMAALFTAINAALWWFNEIKGVRSFQRRRQELIAMAKENGSRVLKTMVVLLLVGIM